MTIQALIVSTKQTVGTQKVCSETVAKTNF